MSGPFYLDKYQKMRKSVRKILKIQPAFRYLTLVKKIIYIILLSIKFLHIKNFFIIYSNTVNHFNNQQTLAFKLLLTILAIQNLKTES